MSQATMLLVSMLATVATLVVGWYAGGSSLSIWGQPALFVLATASLLVQWMAYVPAVKKQTEHFYDLVGACTYIAIVVAALAVAHGADALEPRRLIVGAFVLIWAIRLGYYLGRRVHQVGKDGRFDHIKVNPVFFLMSWTLQGLWVLFALCPVLIIICMERTADPIGLFDVVGWTIWLFGFVIEVIADRQKAQFRKGNETGTWIDEGLWSRCQHPNYFGEITLWTGLFISGINLYEGFEWLAVLSPIFVYILLTRMSGIPMIQERGDKRWGTDAAYRAYRKNTPLLLPIGKRAP